MQYKPIPVKPACRIVACERCANAGGGVAALFRAVRSTLTVAGARKSLLRALTLVGRVTYALVVFECLADPL